MADFDNLSEMNENFDTIKTLLNSIRAQGILNTSDVDKLLSGINSKLEKINTEEDIDLIKIFLTELKQNLDERYGVLVAKFGAIESLFSNLLKNSSEMPKSAELKELFDIVATNLSVFSREVVSQKETLTDITLRLDAMRSDDSQKRDIIKNITLLKTDLDRLNNGFDSIVLSLNDNFKTIIKTISSFDKTDYFDRFADVLTGMEMTSNTILSAVQVLDKKSEQVEVVLQNVATQDDIASAKERLQELSIQNQELTHSIDNLNNSYTKVDKLAEKIDASVEIIANLKSVLEVADDKSTADIMAKLKSLEAELSSVTDDTKFEEFKASLNNTLKNILDGTVNFSSIIVENQESIISEVNSAIQKMATLQDANITRVLNELSTNADALNSKLANTQNSIADLCEKKFSSVFENISSIRNLIAQIDENGVAANNAIFSSITDRLTIFENNLRESLDKQEKDVSATSVKLVEQIDDIKNLSGVLEYKMDSSVVESNSMKMELMSLKEAIEAVLALDFVNTVKELRVDLYASKQELANAFDTTSNDLSEKITNDLYGKYELLISKIDSAEDEFKKIQTESLSGLKPILENISSSIVDVISYVSEQKADSDNGFSGKLDEISNVIKENSFNYVENIREVIDIVRISLENNLKSLEEQTSLDIDTVKKSISENSQDLKNDIKYSYAKLLEIQDSYSELKEMLNIGSADNAERLNGILASADSIKSEFDNQLLILKNSFLDKISELKNDFTCLNADKVSELKFAVENVYNKNSQEVVDLLAELKEQIGALSTEEDNSKAAVLAKILENFVSLKTLVTSMNDTNTDNLQTQVDKILENFESLKTLVTSVNDTNTDNLQTQVDKILENFESLKTLVTSVNDTNTDNLQTQVDKILENFVSLKTLVTSVNDANTDNLQTQVDKILENFESLKTLVTSVNDTNTDNLQTQVDKILENFVSLKTLVTSVNDANTDNLQTQVDKILSDFDNVKSVLNKLDENVDGDMTRQLSIIESNFESLVSQITILFDKSDRELSDKINDEFFKISSHIQDSVAEKLEGYKVKIEETFDILQNKAVEQSDYLQNRISELDSAMKSAWTEQSENNYAQLQEMADKVKEILDDNIKLTAVDYISFKEKLEEFAKNIESNNKILSEDLRAQVDDITKYIDSVIDVQAQDINTQCNELLIKDNEIQSSLANLALKFSDIEDKQNGYSIELTKNVSDIVGKLENINDNIVNNVLQISTNNAAAITELDNSMTERVSNIVSSIEKNETQINDLAVSLNCSTENITNSIQENKNLIENLGTSFNSEVANLNLNVSNNTEVLNNLDLSLKNGVTALNTMLAETSAEGLQTVDAYVSKVLESIELEKECISNCKNSIIEFAQKELNLISKNIEKETDLVIGELVEQFDLIKKANIDEIISFTTKIEDIVASKIYDNIEDLKSYLDVKTDNSTLIEKIDIFKNDTLESLNSVLSNVNRMLDASLFNDEFSDFRVLVEALITESADNLNDKLSAFVCENLKFSTDKLDEKLTLFNKTFIENLTDKYEEIKLVSNQTNNSFNAVQGSLNDIISRFEEVKTSAYNKIDELIASINTVDNSTAIEVKELRNSFEQLRSQISNKSFDEAFQASINKQIGSLEDLVNEQMGYLTDISDLCTMNLPDVTELNTLVKHSVLTTLQDVSTKLEQQDFEGALESEIKQLKTDVITQFLNVFNQISFVAEQEEILDFVNEKHEELITVLSHIVTNTSEVEVVSENIALIDNKIDNLKEDINLINEKITAIMSAEGDIDYVYSLQDLESDIANLRIELNSMKEHNNGNDFEDLINSTNSIYALVETIKSDLPDKKDFERIAEDIVSISTRTNKLLLASDESYKTLQDNLQDFKLVVNDLDERTKNFAQDSGMDKVNAKLNAINSMMEKGAKTNVVFNQVFEYLAEWVDNASVQINSITDKVETLDEIGQIKDMLADLKAGAEDNTETVELVEALGAVFDKQTKRISSLEAKLDKIIVETTINNRPLDISPMEDTLNRFLVAIDEKMSAQQAKIDSLELKLANALELLDGKETAQLTKKVGGMDRQIAKLNKSIEKIASHVVEK